MAIFNVPTRSDSLGLASQVLRAGDDNRLVSDQLGASDNLKRIVDCLRLLSDPIGWQDPVMTKYFGDDFSTGPVGGTYNVLQFGSPHTSGMNAVFADGSTHTISYDIDLMIFNSLGTRNGQALGETERMDGVTDKHHRPAVQGRHASADTVQERAMVFSRVGASDEQDKAGIGNGEQAAQPHDDLLILYRRKFFRDAIVDHRDAIRRHSVQIGDFPARKPGYCDDGSSPVSRGAGAP